MNDDDFDPTFEEAVRAELRRTIVPPPTPNYVRVGVERLATNAIAGLGQGGSSGRTWRRVLRPLTGMAVAATVVALVAAAFVLRAPRGLPGTSSGSPTSPPSSPPSSPTTSIAAGTILLAQTTADGGGFVYTEGDGLRVTTDRGVTWSEARSVPADGSAQERLFEVGSIDFVDARHGWMTGIRDSATGPEVVEYRTADGGLSWQSARVASLPADASRPAEAGWIPMYMGHFADADHGVVVAGRSLNGQVADCRSYTTDDGGISWSDPKDGSCIGLSPMVRWISNAVGYAVAGERSSTVMITEDGGRTWRSGMLAGSSPAMAVYAYLLVADGGHLSLAATVEPWPASPLVFGSSDSGATWSKEYDLSQPAGSGLFSWIVAQSPTHWYASLDIGGADDQLLETTDAGRTWSALDGWGLTRLGALSWWDSGHAMVLASQATCPGSGAGYCGGDTRVFVTQDGGRTWHLVQF